MNKQNQTQESVLSEFCGAENHTQIKNFYWKGKRKNEWHEISRNFFCSI